MNDSLYCRICLSNKTLEAFQESLIQLVNELLDIQIHAKGIQIMYICKNCTKTVNDFHQFKLRCHQVNQYVMETASKLQESPQSCQDRQNPLQDPQSSNDRHDPQSNSIQQDDHVKSVAEQLQHDINDQCDTKSIDIEPVIAARIQTKSNLRLKPLKRTNLVRKTRGKPRNPEKMLKNDVFPREKRVKKLKDDLIDAFPCTKCTESFETKILLNRHFKAYHPACKPTVKCTKCPEIFRYKDHLTRHVIKMHAENNERFRCEMCNKCARSKHALLNHIRLVHTRSEPIKCHVCSKLLKHEYSHKMHMRLHNVDVAERRIVCVICGVKVLNIVSHVNTVHAKKNSDEKRFKCRFCTTTTFQKLSELRQHQKLDHVAELNALVYDVACEQCGKMFTSRANLYQHRISTHNHLRPYPCPLCAKMFKKRASVREHMRCHVNDRPFPCHTCDKRFHSKSKLVNHVRTHTGEKPFACAICAKTFAQKSNVKIHMSVHGKEKYSARNNSVLVADGKIQATQTITI